MKNRFLPKTRHLACSLFLNHALLVLSRLVLLSAPALQAQDAEPSAQPFDKRFALVMPSASEESWRAVGWHTSLMEARKLAQEQNRPVFLWIIVGNPHGCT